MCNFRESIIKSNQVLSGVLKLHSGFHRAWTDAQEFYRTTIDPSYENDKDSGAFIAQLDIEENIATVYFLIKGVVLRPISLKTNLAFFFPVTNQENGDCIAEGIKNQLLTSIDWEKTLFEFKLSNLKSINTSIPIYSLSMKDLNSSSIKIKDDIGKVWNNFSDIDFLRSCEIPSELLIGYNIVGDRVHITDAEIDCVLFAELNPRTERAIKVLRWFPRRSSQGERSLGNVFFEFGYLSGARSIILHQYMIKNHTRILFGIKHKHLLTIRGGIELFKKEDICFPHCLINIPIYE